MRRTIRGRLLTAYLVLILLTVTVAGSAFLAFVDRYYVSNIEDILRVQGGLFARFFDQYVGARANLDEEGQELAVSFARDMPGARVQILGAGGALLGDSTLSGPPVPVTVDAPEVQVALQGQSGVHVEGVWAGRRLHAAFPLRAAGVVGGAVRLSTELAGVAQVVGRVALWIAAVAALILLLSALVGLFLARTVVGPVERLTQFAERIARGDLALRAPVQYRDEVGRLTETLNQMAAALGDVDRLRRQFIHGVSHELRTPLAAIKGWAVTLLDGLPPAAAGEAPAVTELRQGLTILDQEADRLTRLVEDLLDFSRLEAGGLKLRRGPLQPGPLLQQACLQMSPRAERAGIDLRCRLGENLPIILADRDRLKQVAINLLDNAIKFTPVGGCVELAAQREGEGLLVVVRDTGPGIPAGELPRVTERFFRGGGAAKAPGAGLGLSIVHEIVTRHGGRLKIAGEGGTTVRVWFPAQEGAE